MKKILLALAAVFMLNACSEADPASLKGKTSHWQRIKISHCLLMLRKIVFTEKP